VKPEPIPPEESGSDGEVEPGDGSASDPGAEVRSPIVDTAPAEPGNDATAPAPPLPGDDSPPRVGSGAPGDDEPDAAEAASAVGRLVSEEEVLLRLDPDQSQWQRVPKRDAIYASDKLLSLPTFRPNVALAIGVTLQLVEGTAVQLEGPDALGIPTIHIEHGKLILLSLGKPNIQVRLRVGDQRGIVIFGKDDATVAIEVQNLLEDGADPEAQPAARLADIYVASGQIRWMADPNAADEVVSAPAHRPLMPGNQPQPADQIEIPSWLSADLGQLERNASVFVENHLQPDRPVSLSLKELAGHRRVEISELASRSLALVDEFEGVIPLLRESSQKIAWPEQLAALRGALARGPEAARRVREAFESQRGAAGAELYRMLWGYNAQQLNDGAARQLVKYLDHPDLDFRVLSFWNLERITGKTLFYRPEYTDAQRRQPVYRWQKQLEGGDIVPKEAG